MLKLAGEDAAELPLDLIRRSNFGSRHDPSTVVSSDCYKGQRKRRKVQTYNRLPTSLPEKSHDLQHVHWSDQKKVHSIMENADTDPANIDDNVSISSIFLQQDLALMQEIFILAEEFAQKSGNKVQITDMIQAYQITLKNHGMNPAEDTLYYRMLLNLCLRPNSEISKKNDARQKPLHKDQKLLLCYWLQWCCYHKEGIKKQNVLPSNAEKLQVAGEVEEADECPLSARSILKTLAFCENIIHRDRNDTMRPSDQADHEKAGRKYSSCILQRHFNAWKKYMHVICNLEGVHHLLSSTFVAWRAFVMFWVGKKKMLLKEIAYVRWRRRFMQVVQLNMALSYRQNIYTPLVLVSYLQGWNTYAQAKAERRKEFHVWSKGLLKFVIRKWKVYIIDRHHLQHITSFLTAWRRKLLQRNAFYSWSTAWHQREHLNKIMENVSHNFKKRHQQSIARNCRKAILRWRSALKQANLVKEGRKTMDVCICGRRKYESWHLWHQHFKYKCILREVHNVRLRNLELHTFDAMRMHSLACQAQRDKICSKWKLRMMCYSFNSWREQVHHYFTHQPNSKRMLMKANHTRKRRDVLLAWYNHISEMGQLRQREKVLSSWHLFNLKLSIMKTWHTTLSLRPGSSEFSRNRAENPPVHHMHACRNRNMVVPDQVTKSEELFKQLAWKRWKRVLQFVRMLKVAIIICQKSRLSKRFYTWVLHSDQQNKAKRYNQFISNRHKKAVFALWKNISNEVNQYKKMCDELSSLAQRSQILKAVMEYNYQGLVHAMFSGWRAWYHLRTERHMQKRQALEKFAKCLFQKSFSSFRHEINCNRVFRLRKSHLENFHKVIWFKQMKTIYQHHKDNRERDIRAILQFCKRRTMLAWLTWRRFVSDVQVRSNKREKAVTFYKHQSLHKAFTSWICKIIDSQSKIQDLTCFRIRMDFICMNNVVRAWQGYASQMKSVGLFQTKRDNSSLYNIFSLWHYYGQRRKLFTIALQLHRLRLTKSAFESWKIFVTLSQERWALDEFVNSCLFSRYVRTSFLGWRDKVAKAIYRRELHQMTISNMLHGQLLNKLAKWKLFAHSSTLLKKNEKRVLLERKRKTFAIWHNERKVQILAKRRLAFLKRNMFKHWQTDIVMSRMAQRLQNRHWTVLCRRCLRKWKTAITKSVEGDMKETRAIIFATPECLHRTSVNWVGSVEQGKYRGPYLLEDAREVLAAWAGYANERNEQREQYWSAEAFHRRHRLKGNLLAWHDHWRNGKREQYWSAKAFHRRHKLKDNLLAWHDHIHACKDSTCHA